MFLVSVRICDCFQFGDVPMQFDLKVESMSFAAIDVTACFKISSAFAGDSTGASISASIRGMHFEEYASVCHSHILIDTQ